MAPALEKADSVYDFLYFDLPRLRLFNSQFSQYGHITELTRSTSTTSSSGGGFDVKVVRSDTEDSEETGISKRYDTQFIAPLTFLDHAKGLIIRNIANAGIGQFVLVSGSLRILNLAMLQAAWELSSVKRLVSDGAKQAQQSGQNRHERRSHRQQSDDGTSGISMLIDMLRIMPHGLQGQLRTPIFQVWSAMQDAGFITRPSDLLLNHGVELTGTWNLVGILDAKPAPEAGEPEVDLSTHSLVGNLALSIQPVARQLLGRPPGSYGVTPLIVFREVTLTP